MASKTSPTSAYLRVDIETASQGKLIVMMFNGAIRFAGDARRCIEAKDVAEAHNKLVQAQDIVSELRGSLNMEAGELARSLDRSYEYFHYLLVTANINKDTAPIDECITHMTSVRDTWEELFERLSREEEEHAAPTTANRHGAAVMNLEG